MNLLQGDFFCYNYT